ncbi:YitT family protein [Lachnoclostridium sp. Marseille-P6806]|uniref:YitT family protein n=1 Tax=Lachnoclostridium sp. Marseille-P6806 TaxID=2364793 RepID=UPI001030686C|nr:YitT family protein [Lachnoclostridium sp. Marseille-P6806]
MKLEPVKDGKRLLAVLFAALVIAVNIKTFVRTGDLFPGGVTGLTLLIQRVLSLRGIAVPYFLINFILNAIPIYIGFRYIGRKFTLFSLVFIVVNGFLVDLIPAHAITYDTLLIAVFGGIINGAAIALCLSVDATSGGLDFISIFLSQRKGVDSFNFILALNVVIIGIAGFLFGWDRALYSIVYQYVSTQVLHLLYRTYQQQTLFIVTNHPEEVCREISQVCRHGATILRGEGSYGHAERDMVYSVISAEDAGRIIPVLRKTDPDAFINSIRTTEVRGHFYLKPKD